jgi:hypothetical protein
MGDLMSYKRLVIGGVACIGLIIISLSIVFGFKYLVGHNKWIGLVIGILLMIVGILIYQLGKMHTFFYWLAFVFNMMGIGLSITAYYVFKAFDLAREDFLTAIFVSMSLLIGFGVITFIPFFKRHLKWVISIVIFISFITSLILWLSVDTFTGLSFYYLNVIYFFMVGIIASTDSFKGLSKEMAWVSFGAFFLVSIIVLIILSEGEALSGMDFGPIDGASLKKRRK